MLLKLHRLYKRSRLGDPVVVVSGLPRSGTSMAMKMLEAGGIPLYTDHVRRADEDNPKGYFEFERVKNLHQEQNKAWLRDARGKAVKVISDLLPALPEFCYYRVIFLHRHLDEVIASQNKMLERLGETPPGGGSESTRAAFERHLRQVRFWLDRQRNVEAVHLQHRDIVNDPRAEARRMAEFLRCALDIERMAGAVDPNLYRNRR